MTHAQWRQLSNQAWLAHYQVQAIMDRNRKPRDPCDKLRHALACASKGHRRRSHITRRLVMATVQQLHEELACR